MYTDENSDKDSDYGQRSPENSPNVTKKSVSTVGFRSNSENQNARPLALRATQSYTETVDELKMCGNLERINLSPPNMVISCPCGCFLHPTVAVPFRTREQNTLALHVVPPDALMYHGYQYEPSDIAMFWKKDCRMFLWKGKSRKESVIQADLYEN